MVGGRIDPGLCEIAELGDDKSDEDARLRGAHDGMAHEVSEIVDCFEADWHRQAVYAAGDLPASIWCGVPVPVETVFASSLTKARHHLFVQNERFQDAVIIERLVRAARRGVKGTCHGASAAHAENGKASRGRRRPSHPGRRRDQGSQAQTSQAARQEAARRREGRDRRLDQSRAGSFDARRELGIEVRDKDVVKRLAKVARHDWEHSTALDLSDQGLLADLEKRHAEQAGADTLVLNIGKGKHKKKKD